jgi:hypothetical protein
VQITTFGQHRPQHKDAAGDRASLLQSQTHRRLASLRADLPQSRDAVINGGVAAIVKEIENVPDPAIAGVVDIAVGQNVKARRQGPHTQPVAGMNDCGSQLIDDQKIASVVPMITEFTLSQFHGVGGGGAVEQIAKQQTATAWFDWRLVARPIGDGDENAVLVNAQPGAAADRIATADHANFTIKQLWRFAPTSVKLLAVGTDDDGSFLYNAMEERDETHGNAPEQPVENASLFLRFSW